jgi:hypothetical protein
MDRHKVFVSYHHIEHDQTYRNQFEALFAKHYQIMVSKSVQIGDINPSIQTDTVRQKIRDEYLRDSTVTVVLIGQHTWQRKHVDWEISSSIRSTLYNSRSGLLGIFLPSYSMGNRFNPKTIPPRLYSNLAQGFAKVYNWSTNPNEVQNWIHEAFERRNKINPDNSYPHFANNRTGNEWQ